MRRGESRTWSSSFKFGQVQVGLDKGFKYSAPGLDAQRDSLGHMLCDDMMPNGNLIRT